MKNVRQRAFICWQAELAFPCWSRKAWHKTLSQWVADPHEDWWNSVDLLLQDWPTWPPGKIMMSGPSFRSTASARTQSGS